MTETTAFKNLRARRIYRGVRTGDSAPDLAQLLRSAGYVVRGRRADCPHCKGHSRFTVAIKGDLFFCHRCHVGGSIRSLARRQGVRLPPPRARKADIPKRLFRDWLSEKMRMMARREHRLFREARWAHVALVDFPDHDGAWQALAEYYNERRTFEAFWESAADNIGRYWLYRAWRSHAR